MSVLSRALWRDLRGRPTQFLSVGLVIALGAALFTASFDAFLNLSQSYEAMYRDTRMAHVVAIGGPTEQVRAAEAEMPGLVAVTSRTVADVPFRPRPDHSMIGRVVGMPETGHAAVNDILVTRGTSLVASEPDGVVVEQHMADHFGYAIGDTFSIATADGWQDVHVLGIAASPEYLWPARSRQEVLVLPDDFGVVFAQEAFVASLAATQQRHEVLVRLADDASSDAIEQARRRALEAGAADAYTIDEQPSNAALQEDVSGFAELSVMFPAFFLLAAAFATYVLLARMVAGQQANIGTLRASGFASRTIVRHYAAIGVVLGAVASVVGVVLGALLAEAVTRLYTGTLGIPVVVVEVRPGTIAVGLLAGTLSGFLAAYVPARSAGKIAPAAAMRGPSPPGGGGLSLLERLVPPMRGLPVHWLSAVRGIGRARRRSLSTVLGVVLATMLIVVSWGFIDSIQVLLDQQFKQVQRYDAQLQVTGRAAADVAADVAEIEGVAAVETALALPVSISSGSGSYSTTLTALQPDSRMHALFAPDGSRRPVPDDGLLLGQSLRDQLKVDVGDQVTVSMPGVPGALSVPVAGFVEEPLGTYAYTSLEYVSRVAGDALSGLLPPGSAPANMILLTFDPGVRGDSMRGRLSAVDGVAAFVDSEALYQLAQQYMSLFYVFIGVMIVLGGVLAFALIYNTMSANISERMGELAVLRTVGMSRRAIGSMVTAQNLLLTIIGLLPGLVLGWALAWGFMASFSSDMFTFELYIRPTTYLFTAIAIVVVGLLSQWPALRAVARIDLGRVVRERGF